MSNRGSLVEVKPNLFVEADDETDEIVRLEERRSSSIKSREEMLVDGMIGVFALPAKLLEWYL